MDVTIHGFAQSTYTRTARMAAIEAGVSHKLAPIEYGESSHLALHPFGKMPILTDGSTTIFETLAILEHLDAGAESAFFFGTSPKERADVLRFVSTAIDYAYRPVVHIEVTDGEPDPDQLAKADRVLDWLESSLAGPWLVGDSLTAADLFYAPMVDYHRKQVGEERAFNNRPRLKEWMRRMSERSSFKETAA